MDANANADAGGSTIALRERSSGELKTYVWVLVWIASTCSRPGDMVWVLPCVQQASYLEGGQLKWMLPLYLYVNQISGDDDDDDPQHMFLY